MKAFFIKHYKDTGSVGEQPEPAVGRDDLLVQVHAASVNALDAKIRKGEFKRVLPHRMPLILGNDFAGEVLRVGSAVRRFQVGDEVYGCAPDDRIGSFAERIAVQQDALAHKPKNLDMAQAASLPLVSLTAWQVLVELAQVKPGQKVLVHAGSGGVGSIAIQLAKHLGAFVATTTSTSNTAWVKALGADVVIDYRSQQFDQELKDYDLVLNSLDKNVLEKSIQVLKPGGRLVSISGPPTPALAQQKGLAWGLKQVMRLLSFSIRRKAKQRGIRYDFVFMRANGGQLKAITELVEAGVITPIMDRSFPLAATAEALAYMERGRAQGKVTLTIR